MPPVLAGNVRADKAGFVAASLPIPQVVDLRSGFDLERRQGQPDAGGGRGVLGGPLLRILLKLELFGSQAGVRQRSLLNRGAGEHGSAGMARFPTDDLATLSYV